MNIFPAMHFPLGARGNNFDSQIKRIPFASNGVFCAWTYRNFYYNVFSRTPIINSIYKFLELKLTVQLYRSLITLHALYSCIIIPYIPHNIKVSASDSFRVSPRENARELM